MDRYKAVQWLQEQLGKSERTGHLIDWLQDAWQTMDALQEHLLPESVLMLLLARPTTDQQPESSEEPMFTLERITLGEFFEMISALAWYDTELRKRESSDTEKAAIAALTRLHQRLLTVTVQPPPQSEVQQ